MRILVVLCVVVALIAGCSDEEATPVDLAPSATQAAPDGDDRPADDPSRPATPHAIGESPQARALAEQQCRDDPSAEQGVIRIVDPSTQRVVGEVVVDCDEVRTASG